MRNKVILVFLPRFFAILFTEGCQKAYYSTMEKSIGEANSFIRTMLEE